MASCELVGGCGAEAVAAARDGSFDIVVVDAADGGNAPPTPLASTPAFFADVGRVLTEPSVMAVNVVARDAETLARVRDAAARVGGALFECELPAPLVAGAAILRGLFAVRGRYRHWRAARRLAIARGDCGAAGSGAARHGWFGGRGAPSGTGATSVRTP